MHCNQDGFIPKMQEQFQQQKINVSHFMNPVRRRKIISVGADNFFDKIQYLFI